MLARAIPPTFHLDLAFGEFLWSHHDLPGQSDQVERGELRARTFVAIIQECVKPRVLELPLEFRANPSSFRVSNFQVGHADVERSDLLGPDYAIVVVARFDDRRR